MPWHPRCATGRARVHVSTQVVLLTLVVCPAGSPAAPRHNACQPSMHPPLKACGVKMCEMGVASKSETHLRSFLGRILPADKFRSEAALKSTHVSLGNTQAWGKSPRRSPSHMQPSSQSSALLLATQEQGIIRHKRIHSLKFDLRNVDVFFWHHYRRSPFQRDVQFI